MATERKPVPTSAMYMTVDSRIITILVGPENQQQSFRVHQSLLQARSKNFRNALKPDRFVEAKEEVVRFTEEDPEIFHLYLSFAYDAKEAENYTERIMQCDAPTDWAAFHEWFNPQATKLAKIFVLAHMLLDNDMMQEMFGQIQNLSDADFSFDGKIQAAAFPV
ncbi:hypothetical protein E8E11_011551 [Didymella keratinophila]|nr:hypothetical protein E8E11_011551 [Didymella keratinophila]